MKRMDELEKEDPEGRLSIGTDSLLLLSGYLLFHSSEEIKRLTIRLNWLTLILIVLTALTFVAALRDIFHL